MTSSPQQPPPGLTVGGYTLLSRLGEGGMGVVHLARRPGGERVALKVLRPHIVGDVNIHEVCERVRSLILAEFPQGLSIRRDYDASIPEFRGDMEQLIQVVLNIAHNAAQAVLASR